MKRQTMANLAKDMDTWIEKRDKLSRQVDELKRQKEAIIKAGVNYMRYNLALLNSEFLNDDRPCI